jgi:hypothetical protein
MIISVVSYGCETWSDTLREEHRLTVFENRVLRTTYGPNKEKTKVKKLPQLFKVNLYLCLIN